MYISWDGLTAKPAALQSSVPLDTHSEALPQTKSFTPHGARTWKENLIRTFFFLLAFTRRIVICQFLCYKFPLKDYPYPWKNTKRGWQSTINYISNPKALNSHRMDMGNNTTGSVLDTINKAHFKKMSKKMWNTYLSDHYIEDLLVLGGLNQVEFHTPQKPFSACIYTNCLSFWSFDKIFRVEVKKLSTYLCLCIHREVSISASLINSVTKGAAYQRRSRLNTYTWITDWTFQ